jgi:guanylate kinase
MNLQEGKCIIVSAPSGAGKTTIVHALLTSLPQLAFSVSACSRAPRSNERDGIDYYFIGVEKFKQEISDNSFVEWEEVYTDAYYGTLKSEITKLWAAGKVVIFDVDVVGGLNLKTFFGDNALSVFIAPPSLNALEKRLRNRKTETEDKINQRINKSTIELKRANEFDVIILNDVLSDAIAEAKTTVINFLK